VSWKLDALVRNIKVTTKILEGTKGDNNNIDEMNQMVGLSQLLGDWRDHSRADPQSLMSMNMFLSAVDQWSLD